MIKKINNLGDTIVEVMLSLVIIGAVMGVAYAITNFSLQTELIAQERNEALNIAQNQIEALKNLVNQNPNILNQATNSLDEPICLNGSNIVIANSNNCIFNSVGNISSINSNSPYFSVAIKQQTLIAPSWNKIVIVVTWQGRNVNVNNKVYLFYAFN